MIEPDGFKVEVGESPVKAIRNVLEMSQPEFAVWLGIGISTVSRWERGQGTPSFTLGQFRTLIDALAKKGVNLEDLPEDLSYNPEN